MPPVPPPIDPLWLNRVRLAPRIYATLRADALVPLCGTAQFTSTVHFSIVLIVHLLLCRSSFGSFAWTIQYLIIFGEW